MSEVRFDPNRDRSISRQLKCETASEWYEMMRGTVPIQAIQAMSRQQHASGQPFREVFLDNLERGALILINEEDRVAAREALIATGRTIPEMLSQDRQAEGPSAIGTRRVADRGSTPTATEHLFFCKQCQSEAGRLTLYAPGVAIPGVPGDELRTLSAKVGNQRAGAALVVKSGWLEQTFFGAGAWSALTAIAAGDARTLYGIDAEMVPFWCPTCAASYCAKHWSTWDVFDEGFFDEKRGRCPNGHERQISD